jgi:hypothetical protein
MPLKIIQTGVLVSLNAGDQLPVFSVGRVPSLLFDLLRRALVPSIEILPVQLGGVDFAI